MNVNDLNQREAGGMIGTLRLGQAFLDLFPISLGGCHGMVAVADRIGKQRLFICAAVFLVERSAVAKRFKFILDQVGLLALRDKPALDMPAVLHQIGMVDLLKCSRFVKQRFDNRAIRIVNQNHNVRQLERGALPNLETRRDPFDDGLLRRPDEGLRAGLIFISFHIKREHQAAAVAAASGKTLGQDHAGGKLFQRPIR